jgi:branched-chain amino acid transport system permease protein
LSEFGQYLITGIATGASFALIALGFVAIYRVTHVVNFAQGTFALLGGYIMSSTLDHAIPGPLGAVMTVIVVAIIGVLVGLIAVGNPRLPIIASLMITLGLSLLIEAFCLLIWGDIPTTYDGIGAKALDLFDILILPQQLVVIVVVAIVFLLFQLFFQRTYIGKAVTACALNRTAARIVGIDPRVMALLAFGVAAACGALSGILTTPLSPLTSDADVNIAVNGFAGAIVGGLVNPAGAVIGSLLLGVAQTMMAGYFDPSYQLVVALLVMLAVLIARPEGLLRRS